MSQPSRNKIYEFADFRLDAAHLLLYQKDRQVPLTPKVVETLLALVERCGEVLSKDELMEIVWRDSFVEEGNLSQNLYILRKTLPDAVDGKPLIETLKRRGYRFNGEVSCIKAESAETHPLRTAQSVAAKKANEQIKTENEHRRFQIKENLTAIVGRAKEIAEIKSLLSQTGVRLVTLAGIGGTGKTRLARAVLSEMADEFTDGVVFVELAAITNSELVVPSITQHFGITETGGKPLLENLEDRLRDQKMLIVLDNFEQIIEAAPIIPKLLAAAAKVKFLITSRAPLNLSAENEYIVPPLAAPDKSFDLSFEELANYEAIKLFVERARNVKPNFALTDENIFDVAKICGRLGGLPLAIELAAARIKVISPRTILAKLENSLKLLTGGASDLPARQQTMRDTIEWSYKLLTVSEKRLFRYLAVFADGFTFETAEAVCLDVELNSEQKTKAEDTIEILDIITSLIDKSLITAKEQMGDEQRFRMLEVIREYSTESLEKTGEAELLRRNHALYFLALSEESEPHLNTEQAGDWLKRLEAEHNNLRSAIGWLFINDPKAAAEMAAAIRIYLINHSHLTEGREWLTKALQDNPELKANLRFKLFNGLGFLAIYQGDYAAARKSFEEDLAEGRAANDKKRIAESLRGLGTVAYSQNDYDSAREFLEAGLAVNRELDYKFGIAASLNGLGSLALDRGESQTAQALFEESLTNFRLFGSESGSCYCLINLGAVAYLNGDYAAARKFYGETIITAQNLGYKDRVSLSLDGFAALAVKNHEWKSAAQLAGAAENLREQIGYESEPIDRQRRAAYLCELKTKIDEILFWEMFEQGRSLKLDDAIALCL